MNKLLILGINPSPIAFRRNHSLHRLGEWMTFLGYDTYCFSNVIPYEGKYSHKDVDTNFVRKSIQGHDTIIALGGFVSECTETYECRPYNHATSITTEQKP